MQQFSWIVLTVAISQLVLGTQGDSTQGFGAISGDTGAYTIIPRFPKSIQEKLDGMDKCDVNFIRRLPQFCKEELTPSSEDAEILACSLISPPGINPKIPFGMYPSSMAISTEIKSIGPTMLTNIFHDCAMANMISDACFSMTLDDNRYHQSMYSYSDESSYISTHAESHGVDVDSSLGFGIFSLSASYSQKSTTASMHGSHSIQAAAGFKAEQILGELNNICIDNRDVIKYLKSSFVNEWKNISELSFFESAAEMINEPGFRKLASDGFMIPTSFVFGLSISKETSFSYLLESEQSASQASSATGAGVDAIGDIFSFGASTSVQKSVQNSLSKSNLQATAKSFTESYGPCDFEAELRNNRTLHNCAEKVIEKWGRLTQPTRVATGGFVDLENIWGHIGISANRTVLRGAMNEYFQSCACQKPWKTEFKPGDNGFFCHNVDGQSTSLLYKQTNVVCTSSLWFPNINKDGPVTDFNFIKK